MKACLKLLSAVALALVLLEGSSRAEFSTSPTVGASRPTASVQTGP